MEHLRRSPSAQGCRSPPRGATAHAGAAPLRPSQSQICPPLLLSPLLTTSSLPGFFGPPPAGLPPCGAAAPAGGRPLPSARGCCPRRPLPSMPCTCCCSAPAGRSPPCRARARAAALLPPEEEEAGETGGGGRRSVIRSG